MTRSRSTPTALPALTGRPETGRSASVPAGVTVPPRAPRVPSAPPVFSRSRRTGVAGRGAYREGEGRIGSPDGPAAARAAVFPARRAWSTSPSTRDVQSISDEHHEYEVNL
ncbi:hypothetical protein GCM10017673_07880 [Streptosporangium violaceochromogenes]|nr:hypothetical protein GCM10017673_07880 [Streptosporangium violaceochromogenes]